MTSAGGAAWAAANGSFRYEKRHAWSLGPGEYEILIGASSQDIGQKAVVRVNRNY